MARKKNTPLEASVATDFEMDESPHHSDGEAQAHKPRSIDIVRAAITAGYATAKVALPWIKEHYGVDMKAGNFSVTKSTIEKRDAKAAGNEPKRTYKPRQPKVPLAESAALTPTPAPASIGHMSHSEAAKSVKDLVERLGAAEVKNLADLFGG